MTNTQKWLYYTKHIPSPQNYIEWTWRSIVASALQRRVWLGYDNQQLFSNLYDILVGPPGTGKGLILKEASFFLRYWKLKDAQLNTAQFTPEQQQIAEAVKKSDLERAQGGEQQSRNKKASIADALLIPMAADATTYEALVQCVAESYRRINYPELDPNTGKNELRVYGHSSICFVLQELASLLRKRTDDTVNYLLGLYDCPLDYEYKTKTQGEDRVRRGCLNILAGTTPGFMSSIFDDKLIDEGMASRTFFIYAQKPRFYKAFIDKPSDEQLACRNDLLTHIRKLTSLYGCIEIDDETKQFIEEWWVHFNEYEIDKKPPRLLAYFARKNIHMMKVAMVEHFSESLEMKIPLETYKRAIAILDKEEQNMQYAIVTESSNPIAKISDTILLYLKGEPRCMIDLLCERAITAMANKSQIEEAISFLHETGKIEPITDTNPNTEQTKILWTIKK